MARHGRRTADSYHVDTSPWRMARYCLTVRGFHGNYSDPVRIDVSDEPAPAPQAPEMPTATGTADGIRLAWPVNDPAAARYEIWRRTETDPEYLEQADVPAAPSPSSNAYCAVVAVDADGVRSEAAVLPWTGDGYGASMSLAASGSADGVLLTWKWSCQNECGVPPRTRWPAPARRPAGS
ncbi:hypothetical protein AB0N31_16735 [Streptomyces sp. NPDC051051]|uniref:hypothetical protein n=1 Tax=Streptomyces sp. NPDC051051 TaxID=3155666 RepID=UPI00341D89A0